MTRWTDFIKEYVNHHDITYKEALSNPLVKEEYWKIYPKHSPEGKEYKKIKDQTVKYQQQGVKLGRDDAQRELTELANEQKVKDKSIQYRRDEAQKELSGIAKFQKLTDRQKQYEEEEKRKEEQKEREKKIRKEYISIVPLLYEYDRKYKLIKDNLVSDTYESELKKLKKYIKILKEKLESGTSKSLSKFISREEFNELDDISLHEVGFTQEGSATKKIPKIIETMIYQIMELIEIVPTR